MDSLMTIRIRVQAQQAIASYNQLNTTMQRTAAIAAQVSASQSRAAAGSGALAAASMGGGSSAAAVAAASGGARAASSVFTGATSSARSFVQNGLNPAGKAASSFGRTLAGALNPQAASKTQWLGRQLSYNFSIPLGIAGIAATKWALATEAAVTRVAKVYGDNSALFSQEVKVPDGKGGIQTMQLQQHEIAELAKSFEVLSNKYGVAQSDVANIGADWAQAGVSGVNAAKSVELTLQAMILGEMSAKDATTALISTQAQYGLSIGGLKKTLDVFNMVENTTATNMSDLLTVFSKTASTAKAAGVGINQLAALSAVLIPAAGSAATAGNALKTIMTRLLNPTKGTTQVLNAMGIKVSDVAWQSQNAEQRLMTLSGAFEKLSDAQKVSVSATVGSVYQINKFQAIMDDISKSTGKYQTALAATLDPQKNLKQSVKELNMVLDSNPQKVKQVWVMLQNGMIDVIQPLLPIIVQLGQNIAGLFAKFGNLAPGTQKLIVFFLAFVVVLGPAIRLLGAFRLLLAYILAPIGMVFKALWSLIGVFRGLYAILMLPFRALIAGIFVVLEGVIKAFALAGKGIALVWEGVVRASIFVWEAFVGAMAVVGAAVNKVWMLTGITGAKIWRAAAALAGAGYSLVVFLVTAQMKLLLTVLSGIVPAFKYLGQLFGTAMALGFRAVQGMTGIASFTIGLIATVWANGSKIVVAIWGFAVKAMQVLTASLPFFWSGAMSLIKGLTLATGATLVYIWNATLVAFNPIIVAFRNFFIASNIIMVRAWGAVTAGMEAIWAGMAAALKAVWAGMHAAMLAVRTTFYAIVIAGSIFMATAWTSIVATMRSIWASVHVVMGAISMAWSRAWIVIVSAAQAAWTVVQVNMAKIWTGIVWGMGAVWSGFTKIFSFGLLAMRSGFTAIFVSLGRIAMGALGSLFSVPGLILVALVSVALIFKNSIVQLWQNLTAAGQGAAFGMTAIGHGISEIWTNIVGGIIKVFNMLPEGVKNALLSVIKIVKAAAIGVYKLFSYLNPFAHHSPSLVESVTWGMAVIRKQYASVGNVGSIFKSAASDLEKFKIASQGLKGADPLSDARAGVAQGKPLALPAFNKSAGDVTRLTNLQTLYGQVIAQQQGVVDGYQKKLDASSAAMDHQSEILDGLKNKLAGLQDSYDKAKDAASAFATAPLKGQKQMSDAIFNNDMAVKKLQLQMADWSKTHAAVADIQTQFADLQGTIENLQARRSELRGKGAGSEILGVLDKQIASLKKQQAGLSNSSDPYTKMANQLQKLNDEGDRLNLLNSLKFDPLTRQLDQLANGTKEISFDQAVAGINKNKDAMAKLTPQIDSYNTKIAAQQRNVDAATASHTVLQAQYDSENAKLTALNNQYQQIGNAISDITEELNKMGTAGQTAADKATAAAEAAAAKISSKKEAAAAKAAKAAKDATTGLGGIKGPKDTPALLNFKAGEGADFETDTLPSGDDLGALGRDQTIPGDQSAAIDAFTKQQMDSIQQQFSMGDMFKPLKDAWAKAWAWIAKNIGGPLGVVWEGIKQVFSNFGNIFSGLDWAGDFHKFFDPIIAFVAPIWDKIVSAWKSTWSAIWPKIKEVLSAIWNGITTAVSAIGTYFSNAFSGVSILQGFKNLFAPIVPFLSHVWDTVVAVWNTIWPSISRMFSGVWDGLKSAWNSIYPVIWPLIKSALPVLRDIALAVAAAVVFLVGAISGALGPALTAVGKIIADAATILSGLFDIISATVDFVWKSFLDAFKAISGVVSGVIKVFQGLWDIISGIFTLNWSKVAQGFGKIWDGIKGIIKSIWNGLTGMFGNIGNFFISILDGAGKVLGGFFSGIWDIISGIGSTLWGALKGGLGALVDGVAAFGGTVGKKFRDIFNAVVDWIGTVGGNIVSGLWNGIKNAIGWVWDKITGFVKGIINWFKDLFGIHSPSTVFAELGGNIVEGLWEGIKALAGLLYDAGKWVLQKIWDGIKFVWNSLLSFFGAIGTGIWDGIKSLGSYIVGIGIAIFTWIKNGIINTAVALGTWFGNIGNWIWDRIKSLGKTIGNIGWNILTWIASAIYNTAIALGTWFGNIGNWVWNKVKSLGKTLGDVGKSILNWIASAIYNSALALASWFGNIGNWVWDKIKSLGKTFGDVGKNILNWIGSGIYSAALTVGAWFANIANWIWDHIKNLGSTIAKWGSNVIGWIWDGIKTGAQNIWTWFSQIGSNIWVYIGKLVSQITTWGANIIGWIWNGITQGAKDIWSFFTGLWFSILGFAGDIFGNALQWGKDLIGDIVSGIIEAAKLIWTFFSGIWKSITDNVGDIFGKALQWGKDLIGSIVDGIISVASTVWDAITSIFSGKKGPDPVKGAGLGAPGTGTQSHPTTNGTQTGPGNDRTSPLSNHAIGGKIRGPGSGTSDSIHAMVSNGEFIVKEKQVRKYGNILNRINNDSLPHFRDGGAVGSIPTPLQNLSKMDNFSEIGTNIAKNWAAVVIKNPTLYPAIPAVKSELDAKSAAAEAANAAASLGDTNSSQDPSTFGWQVGHDIVPFSWNGFPFPSGVAAGTQSIWTSFLNELVPIIPGGLAKGQNWGYEDRANVNSPGKKSFHAYGLALDLNAPENPNSGRKGSAGRGTYQIPDYADVIAKKYGMEWGGNWGDAMHFELHKTRNANPTARSNSGLIGATSGTKQWEPLMNKVFEAKGFPLAQVYIMENQMARESGGNQRAINLTDSNARAGHPSVGLLQFIPSTFQTFADKGYDSDIYDPESQMRAFLNYVPAQYGDLVTFAKRGYGAYKNGGVVKGVGTSTSDSNLIAASVGEIIFPVNKYRKNKDLLDSIFNGTYKADKVSSPVRNDTSIRNSTQPTSQVSQGSGGDDNSTTINIYGNLEFPNIKTGADANELVSSVGRLAKRGNR